MGTNDLRVTRTAYQAVSILFALSISDAVFSAHTDSDKHRFDAVLTSVYQYADFDDARDENGVPVSDKWKGSFALDVELEYQPGRKDTLYALGSFARGNGLKNTDGVSVAVNADDLEDDVENINGRNRDYLLEAWYRRSLFNNDSLSVSMSGGIIDATRYLDHNRVANDEITQFMNEVFVTRFFLPSYDPGITFHIEGKRWHVDGLWMHTQTDANSRGGTDYDFFGVDFGVDVDFAIGSGEFHIIAQTTSSDFEDRHQADEQSNVRGLTLSIDQYIGDSLAVFLRAGKGNDEAEDLDHDALYSAGLQLTGHTLSLPELTIGMAYAYLDGAGSQPGDIQHTRVIETYARYPLSGFGDISADLQWISDSVRGSTNPDAFIIGTRLNLYF